MKIIIFIITQGYSFIDLRERKEERNMDVKENTCVSIDHLPPIRVLNGDLTHNLGVSPDPESSPQPFGTQDDAPTN